MKPRANHPVRCHEVSERIPHPKPRSSRAIQAVATAALRQSGDHGTGGEQFSPPAGVPASAPNGNGQLPGTALRAPDARQLGRFRAVLICETRPTGERAEQLCELLRSKAGDAFCFIRNAWSFKRIAVPEIRNIAATAAACADVVILAASGKTVLPEKVKEWIEMWAWLVDCDKPAVVTLLDDATEHATSIRNYVRDAVATKNLSFFSRPDLLLLHWIAGAHLDGPVFGIPATYSIR